MTVVEGDRSIRLVDVETRTVLWEQQGSGGMPLFSADGRSVSASFRRDRTARELRCTTLRRSRRVAVRFSEPFQFYFRASWIDNERAFAVNRYRNLAHRDVRQLLESAGHVGPLVADGDPIRSTRTGHRCYRCTRPDASPAARRSTSSTDTRLKSPGIVCLRALAATANRRLSTAGRPVASP